jgi:hypothetical protein
MTTKGKILKAIKEKCLDCCSGSITEVNVCSVGNSCALFPYRQGKDPSPTRKGRFVALQSAT